MYRDTLKKNPRPPVLQFEYFCGPPRSKFLQAAAFRFLMTYANCQAQSCWKTALFFILLFFSIANFAHAQNPTVRLGEQLTEATSRKLGFTLIGQIGDEVYCYRNTPRKNASIDLIVLDTMYTVKRLKTVIVPDTKGNEITIERFLVSKDKIYLFTSFYNDKQDKNYVFGGLLDPGTAMITNFKALDYIDAENKNRKGSFSFGFSPDSQHILVYHNDKGRKNYKEKFGVQILDLAMEKQWERRTSLSYAEGDISITDVVLLNDLSVYILGRYQPERKTKKEGKPTYDYLVFRLKNATDKIEKFAIEDEGFFLSQFNLVQLPTDKVQLIGTYSNDNKTSKIDGLVTSSPSPFTGSKLLLRKADLPADFLKKDVSEAEKSKNKANELSNYILRNFFAGKDGSITVLMEQYYMYVVTTTTSNGSTSTTYHYVYNNIKVSKIDAAGQLVWVSNILKIQHTVNDDGFFSSISSIMDSKGNVQIIYNDHSDNLNNLFVKKSETSDKTIPFGKLKKSSVFVATVSPEGTVTKKPIVSYKTAVALPRVKTGINTRTNQLLFYAYSRSKSKDRLFNVNF